MPLRTSEMKYGLVTIMLAVLSFAWLGHLVQAQEKPGNQDQSQEEDQAATESATPAGDTEAEQEEAKAQEAAQAQEEAEAQQEAEAEAIRQLLERVQAQREGGPRRPANQVAGQDLPGAGAEQALQLKLSGNDVSVEMLSTGEIVIIGNESDLDILESFVQMLDREPADKETILHHLKSADAQEVADKLQSVVQELWPWTENIPDERISIIAVGASVILITAPPARIDRLLEIADAIDQIEEPIPDFVPMKFFIKNAKASDVAEQLTNIVSKLKQKQQGGEEITIEINPADNSVMVFGPESLRAQIQMLIDQIDVEPVVGHGHIKLAMFPLINTTAQDLADVLEELLTSSEGQDNLKEAIRRLSIIKREADGTTSELPPLALDRPLRIIADKGTNSLIIATIEENIDPLGQIIELLDGFPRGHEMKMRIFPLRFADAESVRDILESMFTDGKKLAERAPGGTKTEAVPDGTLGTALVYNVGLAIDKRANILFVSGRAEQLLVAELVVNELDVPVSSVKFPLQLLFLGDRLDATRVGDIITELFAKRKELFEQTEMGKLAQAREEVFLAVDVRSNALIISASEENYDEIVKIVTELNTASDRIIDDIRIINCQRTNASDLASKIDELWQRKSKLKPEGSTEDLPILVADQRSNALVIASSPEDFDAIQRLVDQLEAQPLSPIAEIRLITMKNNDASGVSDMLKSLFEERAKQRLSSGEEENPSDRVAVAADGATNTMLIASSKENFDEMVKIIEAIDIEPIVEGVVRFYPLQNSEAGDVADKINELFEKGLYHPSMGLDNPVAEERQKIALVADARSNSIIASASRQNLSIIERLIEKMDGDMAALFQDDTKMFVLQHADAVRLADMLEKLFEGRKSDAPEPDLFRVPTIIPDARSNTLIISGARDSLRRCEDLVAQLDRPAGPPSAVFEVYALKHSSAAKLAGKMQALFEKRSEREEDIGIAINIVADEPTNTLITSASRDDHLLISGLLKLLDQPSNIAKQFQIFPLERAKATTVAETLDQLFQQQAEGASGRADAIAVQADERSNSIVVWASASEMENIATIVEKLDTTRPAMEMMVKVVRLKQALAEDFADILTETLTGGESNEENAVILSFRQTLQDGTEIIRKLLRQDITITADPRTNSLMVLAPAESMDLLEAMIVDFDRVKPVTAEIRLFPLINADADEIVTKLEDIFGTDSSGEGDLESQLVFGGGEGGAAAAAPSGEGGTARTKLRFTADRRTNTVIAAGNAIDLVMVAKLVTELDALDIEERVVDVYNPRTIPAPAIAAALTAFTEAENQLLSELDDEVSIRRRADKQVTVVSDEDSNSILLGASQRNYQRYMDLVHQIDKPEPQVMISVLIAEVSIDDQFELGVEFAAQDLNFSERATVGPNGVILGDQFDVITGTDIGAAGVGFGGLTLTVSGEDFSFLFRALQSQGQLEVLSRPTLLVQNNAEGSITIGDRVPIVSGQTSAGGQSSTTIQYEEVGIILDVIPHINPDGYVNLEISPEISQISNQSLQVAEGLNAAVFSERSAETTVTVKDGETVILGGLITENIQNSEIKVPWLGDIPVLGELFKTTTKNATKTELLIVLTVNVLRNEQELRWMSEQERDRTGRFPERLRRHPLMQGLRIRPEDDLLGPLREGTPAPTAIESPETEKTIYGPVPKRYGPPRPTVSIGDTQTLSQNANRPTYGPRLVRNQP